MAPQDTGPRGSRQVTFVETLGKGGFGAVYLADVHGEDNFVQRIAVKVLNEGLGDQADLVARQRDEARILAQLNHDHIVKVFDLSEIHGRPAVFMEYVAGIDAGRLLQAGPVPARAALEIAAAVASALDAAWSTPSPVTGRPLHVVHRDIKPSNILISEHGGVKVLDFGIARAEIEREGETRTHSYGTARYMAPEQWLGGDVGPAVDIYGLGITIVEVLSGTWTERLPLREDAFVRARDQLIHAVRDPRWGAVWWRELSGLLQRMLSMESAQRPSAREVEEALLDLSEQVGGESLGRLARRQISGLMKQRRVASVGAPLVSATDTWHHTSPDPSILTASKQLELAAASPSPPRAPRGRWLHWLGLGLGMAMAASWMLWGWLGQRSEQREAVQVEVTEAPAAPEVKEEAAAESSEEKRERKRERPAGKTIKIHLDSVPTGARVTIDGERAGRTPLKGVKLGLGAHRIRMRAGKERGARQIEVRTGGPTRHIWHQAEGQWSSGY